MIHIEKSVVFCVLVKKLKIPASRREEYSINPFSKQMKLNITEECIARIKHPTNVMMVILIACLLLK